MEDQPIEKEKEVSIAAIMITTVLIAVLAVILIASINTSPTSYAPSQNAPAAQTAQSQVANKPVASPAPAISQPAPVIPAAPQIDTSQITAADIAPYLTEVGQVICNRPDANGVEEVYETGSGSLFSGTNGYFVLTNEHVIRGNDTCQILIGSTPSDPRTGLYGLDISNPRAWNTYTDVALIPIKTGISLPNNLLTFTPIPQLNFQMQQLPYCPNTIPQGSPVVVIGYPAYATNSSILSALKARIVSNGSISGYDTAVQSNLPYANYFISGNMDSGNSGGIALSKDSNGLCVLGIPTWISVGNYQTQGIIQNINNVVYTQ